MASPSPTPTVSTARGTGARAGNVSASGHFSRAAATQAATTPSRRNSHRNSHRSSHRMLRPNRPSRANPEAGTGSRRVVRPGQCRPWTRPRQARRRIRRRTRHRPGPLRDHTLHVSPTGEHAPIHPPSPIRIARNRSAARARTIPPPRASYRRRPGRRVPARTTLAIGTTPGTRVSPPSPRRVRNSPETKIRGRHSRPVRGTDTAAHAAGARARRGK